MKNAVILVIGALLLGAFGMQVFMFYRIHQMIDQRFALENKLAVSSRQGSATWIQSSDQWDPYQELLQMRDQMERLLNDTFSRFQLNTKPGPLTKMPAIDLKDEPDRYVVTVDVPGSDESTLDVAIDGRQLRIWV